MTNASVRRMPAGEAQTRATLREMAVQVNRALYQPATVRVAVDVVRYVDGRDTVALYETLKDWLDGHVAFLRDPRIVGDVLRTPDYALREIAEHGVARLDCDDCAMLAAALAKAIGLAARFCVLGFPQWAHVYTEVLTARGWLPLDVTETEERRARAAELRPRRMRWVV